MQHNAARASSAAATVLPTDLQLRLPAVAPAPTSSKSMHAIKKRFYTCLHSRVLLTMLLNFLESSNWAFKHNSDID
jgi:hypothetical protein